MLAELAERMVVTGATATPSPRTTDTDVAAVTGFSSDVAHWLLTSGLRVLAIVVVATLVRWVLVRAVNRLVRRTVNLRMGERLTGNRTARVLVAATGGLSERRRQRTETLGSVLSSLVTAVVFTTAALMVLSEFRVNLAPLLASAGVAGVALGFGAQSLVKDFLSGMFMMFEDQYGVGDLIDTGEAVGTVEEVTLRITKLRDPTGVAWFVRNGEITRIANKSQGWSTAIVDLPVAYTEDVERVQRIIRDVLVLVSQDETFAEILLDGPSVAGVEQISGSTVTIRVVAKTAPNQQWALQREIREQVKVAFDAAGVRAALVYPPPAGPGAGASPGAW